MLSDLFGGHVYIAYLGARVFEDLDLLLNFPDMDAADIGTSVPVESPHNDVPAGGRRE